jgi:hypothetical protein
VTQFLSVDLEGDAVVQHFVRELPRRAPRAIARAFNRSIVHARAQAIPAIRQLRNLKPGYLRERLEILRATAARVEARLVAPRRGTLLSRFPFRQLRATYTPLRGKKAGRTVKRKAGIQVEIRPGRPEILPGAFLVPLRRGNVAAAGGLGVALRPAGSRRHFEVLHSTSVHDVLGDVLEPVAERMRPFLTRQLLHELEFEVGRLSRRSA